MSNVLSSAIEVSFLLPIHNESECLKRNLSALNSRVSSLLKKQTYEIIVIDNGSDDSTSQQTLENLQINQKIQLISIREKGRGPAIRKGCEKARGKYICILSIDRSWSEEFIPTALALCQQGNDVVYGPKSHPQSIVTRPWVRKVASQIIRVGVALLFRISPQDTQCIKMFRKDRVKFLSSLMDCNYFAETEFFLRARYCGLKSVSIPVKVFDKRKESKVKLHSIIEFFYEALRFKQIMNQT